ncbi:hypothetical protein pEaSNUABM11_00173 [Erwinia phage pEa_SNUABM_11]|nr:hypothetical protein pEaSNUABM11_00173 [Erwinia phage pEa_SNUABM_11]
MALRLSWTNRNVVANAINIYRGNSALDPLNLPAPTGTVTNGDAFYVDQTAEFGKTYYYILGTKTSNDEILTPNQPILVADNRGAGPAALKYGDDNLGYFGTLLSSEFFTSSHIRAAAKDTSGLPSALYAPTWHKMIRNGKVIYLPDIAFGSTTWMSLYTAGLVYGIDANYPADALTTGLTPTNQLVKLSLNGEDYKVRLLRGYSDGSHANILSADINDISMDDYAASQPNEWSDLAYGLFNFVPLKQHTVNFADIVLDNIIGPATNTSSSSSNGPTMTASRITMQERTTTALNVTRARRNAAFSSVAANSRPNLANIHSHSTGNTCLWYPVIELIETPTANVTV